MRRVINYPKRGIGDRALEILEAHAKSRGYSFWGGLNAAAEAPEIPPKAAQSIRQFTDMVSALAVLVEAKVRPSVIVEAVLEQSGLLSELANSTDPQDEVRV